ncbi:MAG: hypothetical protein NTZ01_06615 [Verrucomicrobia bacterium]|nr:hypothetical protein [Verrucomicrobiota bacterium]
MVPRILMVGWILSASAFVWAQLGDEPVRKAEAVEEEVRQAQPLEEPVRKAERVEKPKTDTGQPIHPHQPVIVKIESPEDEQVVPWETVDVFVRVENYALGEGGNRINVIVDNGSPMEHTNELKPIILHGMAPGAHSLRVYAVKPDGKMLAESRASDRVNFYVRRKDFSNFQPWDRPYLTVNMPQDGNVYPDADGKVWLDLRAHNAPLSKETFRIKTQMNGVETILSTGDPYAWAGLAEGRHRVVVELIDEDGDPVSEMFARVERTFEIPRTVKAVNPREADSANLWLRKKQKPQQ